MFSTWYKNLFGHLYIYKYMGVIYSIILILKLQTAELQVAEGSSCLLAFTSTI